MTNWPEELIPRKDIPAAIQRVMRMPTKPHEHTVRRWYTKGLNGVLLEVIYLGGRVHTTNSRIRDFFECVNATRGRNRKITVPVSAELAFDRQRAKRTSEQLRSKIRNWGAK